jgi:hypothetical protein
MLEHELFKLSLERKGLMKRIDAIDEEIFSIRKECREIKGREVKEDEPK